MRIPLARPFFWIVKVMTTVPRPRRTRRMLRTSALRTLAANRFSSPGLAERRRFLVAALRLADWRGRPPAAIEKGGGLALTGFGGTGDLGGASGGVSASLMGLASGGFSGTRSTFGFVGLSRVGLLFGGAAAPGADSVVAVEGLERCNADAGIIVTEMGELRGAIGLQAGKRKTAGFPVAEQVDGLLDPAKTNTIAGSWFEELQASQALRFQAAVRLEKTDVEGNGIDFNAANPGASGTFTGTRSFTPLSGSLGALYEFPGGIVASLTGQYVERAPDAGELYSKGVHDATGTFEVGNPFLKKEAASTLEVGLIKARGKFRFDATSYYTEFDGFVFKELDGTQCGDDLASCGTKTELDLARFEQRDATFYGAEVSVQYDVADLWNGVWGIDGQYEFVRAKFSNGENVPRIPPHRLGGGIYYKDDAWYARAGVLHAFDQSKIGLGEIETPGYTLVSAELSYTTTLDDADHNGGPQPTFTLGVKGENLARL